MNSGTVVNNVSFADSDAVDAAFKSVLEGAERFDYFELDNQTQHTLVKLCLFAGYDESGDPLPGGYVRQTGVTVDGQNVEPGGHSGTVLQADIKCYATRVKCSADVLNRLTGKAYRITWVDAVITDPGEYIESVTFTLPKDVDDLASTRVVPPVAFRVRSRPPQQ